MVGAKLDEDEFVTKIYWRFNSVVLLRWYVLPIVSLNEDAGSILFVTT